MSRTLVIALVAVAAVVMVMGVAMSAQGPSVEQGMKVYADQKCQLCHAIDGKGNKKGPLDGIGSKLKADEIRQWIVDPEGMTTKTKAERKPPMKNKYASLPKEDLDALVAYMESLKAK